MGKAKRIIIDILIIAVLVGSGYMIERKLNEYRVALDQKTETVFSMRDGRTVDFEKLRAKNSDVKGWIWLPDSNIDYPVLQAEDNDFYLHRDINKDYLYDGCIFIDAAVSDPFKDFNTVIYGHHMYSGAMFHDLSNFADKEYMNEHKVFVIETEDGSYDLHVVAYCNEPADSDLYTTSFLDPSSYEFFDEFDKDDGGSLDEGLTKEGFVDLVKSRAMVFSGEEFSVDDRFVTLSTCAYNYGDARHQVIGVIRDPSLVPEEVAVKNAGINKWLVFQIAVGVTMTAIVIALVIPRKGKAK